MIAKSSILGEEQEMSRNDYLGISDPEYSTAAVKFHTSEPTSCSTSGTSSGSQPTVAQQRLMHMGYIAV
ncbi:MAG: hypothetical protein K0R14_1586 [Burkholderiales bacterium]|nr:hypothetical protein [Burkholderiales bacterium]